MISPASSSGKLLVAASIGDRNQYATKPPMMNAIPPRPAMKPTPMVISDRYQMPFMNSGMPISSPIFQLETPVWIVIPCTIALISAAATRMIALRTPAPGDFRMVATATPPG